MTDETDHRIERSRPPAEFDDRSPEPIDAAHRAGVQAGLDDVRAGRLATPDDVVEAFARFRRRAR